MSSLKKFPFHGWVGVLFVGVFWVLNWFLPGLRTHWAFFPLWLGYALFVDGLVLIRKGHSLFKRKPKAYLGLFIVSVLGWWLFELYNRRTQNWTYVGIEYFTSLEYALLASLSFSTVIPAVFGTAELVGTFNWLKRIKPGRVIHSSNITLFGFFFAGLAMLLLLAIWPSYFFPFVWLSVYFILEPINVWFGNRSLAYNVSKGDWRPVYALWLGAFICGLFWEMWNYFSYPKWIYHIPYVDFWRVFEMPFLGYGGYLPFALELYALYHFITGLFGKKHTWNYIDLVD